MLSTLSDFDRYPNPAPKYCRPAGRVGTLAGCRLSLCARLVIWTVGEPLVTIAWALQTQW